MYGSGHGRKMKGTCAAELLDGARFEVELRWYESHGIGRRKFKIKDYLRRL